MGQREMDVAIRGGLWWLCLVIGPLVLAGMELFHPSGFTNTVGMYAYLCTSQPYDPRFWALAYFGPQWWFTLHLIQLPLLALVAVGLWQAMNGIEDGAAMLCAWVSRIGTFFFLVGYTALDAIGGVGLGKTMMNMEALREAGRLTQSQMDGIALVLDVNWADRWIGGVGSVASLTGSWAVFIAALFAAIALYFARRAPWPPLVLLVAFGWVIQTSHASPFGPLGFLLLAVAGAWIKLSRRGASPAAQGEVVVA